MGKLKNVAGVVLLFLGSVSAADSFVPSAVLFETAAGQILGALNGAVPGNPYSVLGPFQVKVKGSGTPVNPSCTFDATVIVTGTLTSGGYLCQVPPQAAVNGMHSISSSGVMANYLLSNQPPVNPTLSCSSSKCVQDALNGAQAGTAVLPTVLDFGGSQITNCGLISLDAVKPYVTIKNLTLTGSATDCTIGNSFAHAVTNNVVLDTITVINGTHTLTNGGAASVTLYGINNTVQNSVINGGTASGVYLGGSNNVVRDTTFNKVNTNNANSMTSCSGVLVAGYHELVAFNTFNTCDGSCVHVAPDSRASPNIASNLTGNDSIWGNLIINSLNKSFVGTLYEGDGGSIYAGWNNGKNTTWQWNVIQGINTNNFGNKACGGFSCGSSLYLDNNTSYYTVSNNFVDINPVYPAARMNPQDYFSNPGGTLKSEKRTLTNNYWTGNTPLSASMKVTTETGQRVMMTSPDASCPWACNNKANAASKPPFTAGVGSGSTLPAPQFLPSL